ncbi:MAG: SDR family NAD(P)-dependent oxidoreductase [Aquabacterium sp.]|nr:SDR family NAD(P)-dependent oxidoreductase [Aquabacterium sp.]
MKLFKNKVAAITGAGSGIGRALALNLAKQGCHLALADVNDRGLTETVAMIKPLGVRVTQHVLDVADEAAVFAWAQSAVDAHGHVNLLFNNAGVALSGTVAALSTADYDWIMRINFFGVLYGTKAFLPILEKSGEGHIVNISSVFGLTAQPLMSGYNASKYAVRGFTESLRQDLDLTNSCVSATCVHPGGIKTNVAKSARMSDSVAQVTGMSNKAASTEFERTFITSADSAANTIIKGVQRNARRVLIGPDARLYDWMVRIAPAGYQRLVTAVVRWRSKA